MTPMQLREADHDTSSSSSPKDPRQTFQQSWMPLALGGAILVVIALLVPAATGALGGGSTKTGGAARSHASALNHPSCSGEDLQASVTSLLPSQPGATLLSIWNKSSRACELSTFPQLRIVDSVGRILATASPPRQVDIDLVLAVGSTEAKVANLYWQNWCSSAVRPIAMRVSIRRGGGTFMMPYGLPSDPLPACTNPGQPTSLMATGGMDSGSLFGTGR
jgi:hypothetical protein